jgi:type I restriction enzyme M protein
VETALKDLEIKPSAPPNSSSSSALSVGASRTAPPVIKKVHKGKAADPARPSAIRLGQSEIENRKSKDPKRQYEPDSELRDFEQIPLLEEGGIEAFIRREVLPYTPDAWLVEADTKIGYEVSFTRHFYQPPQLRTLAQISADILAVEKEAEGLLDELLKAKA